MIRKQLPAYSPLSPTTLIAAAVSAASAPGRARKTLETSLATRFRAEEVVLTGSATQALQRAIGMVISTPLWEGRPVALPAYSCFDLVTAAVGNNAPVSFYDVDPVTLTPDMDGVRSSLREGACAVVAGNLFGFPVDWESLQHECQAADALLIEDAAQATGCGWKGRESGTFGDLSILSFGRGKGWTGGSGGALLGRRQGSGIGSVEMLPPNRLRSPTALAVSFAQWVLGRPSLFGLPSVLPGLSLGETVYKEPGRVEHIAAFSAAAAAGHAGAALREAEVRRSNALRWDELLGNRPDIHGLQACAPLDLLTCGYLRYPVLAGEDAATVLAGKRAVRMGVARAYPSALPRLPAARRLGVTPSIAMPGASRLARELFTLPTHSLVRAKDIAGFGTLLENRQKVPKRA